jgi:hypothetical protein
MHMDKTEGSERIHPVPDRGEGFHQSQPRVSLSIKGGQGGFEFDQEAMRR